MKRLWRFFSRPEFPLVLFVLSVMVWLIPLFTTPFWMDTRLLFYYLYGGWSVVTVILFCMSRGIARKETAENKGETG